MSIQQEPTPTTATTTIEIDKRQPQEYHPLPSDIGTDSNPFHITLNVLEYHISKVLKTDEADEADEAIITLGSADITGTYARTVCILCSPEMTDAFTASITLQDGTGCIAYPQFKTEIFDKVTMDLIIYSSQQLKRTLPPMLVEVKFVFDPSQQNLDMPWMPVKVKPFICDSFITKPIYPNEALYYLLLNENIKPGIQFYERYCSSKSPSLSSVETTKGTNNIVHNNNNTTAMNNNNTIYSLYPDNITPQDILDNPFYPICMTPQTYEYELQIKSLPPSPSSSQSNRTRHPNERIIWNGVDITHRLCQYIAFEIPTMARHPNPLTLVDRVTQYCLSPKPNELQHFHAISKLTCVFLAPFTVQSIHCRGLYPMITPYALSLFRVGCDGRDQVLMDQHEKISANIFRYLVKKKLFQNTLASTTIPLPQPQPQPPIQYNFPFDYPYTNNDNISNNNIISNPSNNNIGHNNISNIISNTNNNNTNNNFDLGLYYNPIPLTINAIVYHLKLQLINDMRQILLGNAILTHQWVSALCFVVDVQPAQDGSPDKINLIISDGTAKLTHWNVHRDSSNLRKLWELILEPEPRPGEIPKKDFSKLYRESKYYPLLLEYRTYLCPFPGSERLSRYDCFIPHNYDGVLNISDTPRHHQYRQEPIQSYDLYNITCKQNIDKARLFYETNCLTSLQRDAFIKYQQVLGKLNEDQSNCVDSNNNNVNNINNQNQNKQDNNNNNNNNKKKNNNNSGSSHININNNLYHPAIPTSLYNQYHPIFDNPCVPIPLTLQMMNSLEFTALIVDDKDKTKRHILYCGYDVTWRINEMVLSLRGIEKNTPSPTRPGCGHSACSGTPCYTLQLDDFLSLLRDVLPMVFLHHDRVSSFRGGKDVIRSFSVYCPNSTGFTQSASLWHGQPPGVSAQDNTKLLADHSRLAAYTLLKSGRSNHCDPSGMRYQRMQEKIAGIEEFYLSEEGEELRQELEQIGKKNFYNDNNKKKNINDSTNNNNSNNTNKCTCPKQGCILHGDDGYDLINKIKLFEDNNKLYDKTINDNKQYINELQHKIEKLKQQYNILNKQDRGTPWEHYHQSQQQQQKQNLSPSSQKQKDNKKQQSNKTNKNNKNMNNNNDKIQQQSVLYYKSNSQRYPQYIQDKMLEYKQRITILRQQLEQHYITIKQNNTKINNNNNPIYIQKKQQYQILQQRKEEYELLHPTLQDQYNNIQKDLQDIILSNNTIQTKYLLLLNRLKMAREQYQQYNNNNNQQYEYIDLYKSLTHLYTTIDMKGRFNYQQQQYQNHQGQYNDKQDVINKITPLHTSMIHQHDQININTDNNNSNDIMFLNTFSLSQPNLLVPSSSSTTTTTTVPKLQHGDSITNTSQLLSNNISLPTTIGESLYNTYSHLYHYFTTPSSSSTQQSLFDQPQPLIYKDHLTLYQSYLNIINTNQNQITQGIYNITKRNYIAHLLPHIGILYNTLTTSIITQYTNIYYNDNYIQYYPNILDYWKSLVSTSTIMLYHAFLRLFTLSSLFNSFNTTTTTLPSHLYHTSQSHYQQQQEHHIISFHSYHQQQQKQYTNILNSLYQILHDKKQQATMSKLSDIAQESQKHHHHHHHTSILTIEKKCCVCFTTASTTIAIHNNNNTNNDFVSSTCCHKMIVCRDCIPIVHDTKCAHCGQSNTTFL